MIFGVKNNMNVFKIEDFSEVCVNALNRYRSVEIRNEMPDDLTKNTRGLSQFILNNYNDLYLRGFLVANGVKRFEAYDACKFAEQNNFWMK